MADDRSYKFEIGQQVRIVNGIAGIAGEVIDRQAEPDHDRKYDIKRFPDGRVTCKSQIVPMNSYMVKFTGAQGRPDTGWWLETDIVAA